MALIARILGVSLLTGILVAGVGVSLLKSVTRPTMPAWIVGQPEPVMPEQNYTLAVFILACVGGLIGAVAGAAREIVSAQRQKASDWADTKS